MDRRIFLKFSGLCSLFPSLSFRGEKKSQWISCRERLPKIGQKVALYTVFNGNSVNILTGQVCWEGNYTYDKVNPVIDTDYVRIAVNLTYSPDGYFIDHDVESYICFKDDQPEEKIEEAVNRANWIKGKKLKHTSAISMAPRFVDKRVGESVGRTSEYWTPIDEYIPRTLPEFPK